MQTSAEFSIRAWKAMCHLYGRSEVSQLCVSLQDSYGVDVPLLLLLLHAEQQQLSIDIDDFRALLTDADAWRGDVVKPLRTVRQAMKGRYVEQNEVRLRDAVKALELQAEQVHVSRLAQSFMAYAKPMAASRMSAAYLQNCDVPTDECETALAVLKAAADQSHFQDLDGANNGYA
ncbi:TIGR02444 family protein [Agrobacterium rubi]|uniref:TIGR02444 family protein n=1 Tax=Agrobacterium rubi TaxID=28099 RepID=UPI001572891F|nr:TIGR02444 family protein [Agrobacterium rubi]NTF10405.1 TIGR02444 family protein [Agrobacterium rubi]NTF22799.1 TIGR02444 family protein [Agrobacterium rubi]NTF29661.1 TIGR02444 family protein [Agrobacterium rubi]